MRISVTVVHGWLGGEAEEAAAVLARLAGPAGVLLHPGHQPPPAGVEAHRLDEEVADRSPGCDCCAVRLDLVDILGYLGRRREPPRHAVVACSPGADPATPVVTLLSDPGVRAAAALDGVIACLPSGSQVAEPLLDAAAMADHLCVSGGHSAGGALAADGLASNANPAASTGPLRTRHLHLDGWSARAVAVRLARVDQRLTHPSLAGRSVVLDLPGRLDPDRLDDWLEELHRLAGARLLRLEGRLALAGDPHERIILGCRTVIETAVGRKWADQALVGSRLRVVGRNLDGAALELGLADCAA